MNVSKEESMPIDIKNLSSQELFELAKRKEKEEQEAKQRIARLSELKRQVKTLIAEHEEALAATEKAIKELQEKRTRLMADFKATLAPLELDIQELERKVKVDQATAASAEAVSQPRTSPAPAPRVAPMPSAQATPQPAAIQPSQASAPAVDTTEELLAKIRSIMGSRSYVSESLLKEKLKTNGFDVRNLKADIEKLLREGKLEKKGIGNYALGKKK